MGKRDIIADLRARMEAVTPQDSPFDSSGVTVSGKGPDASKPSKRGEGARAQDAEFGHDDASLAFKKIIALVNVSDKSEKAIRAKLADAEFGEQAIESAVERARSYRFIDDMRYADVLIRSRIAQGKGMAGIERELRKHDIEPSEVPGWPYEYEEGLPDEFDRALEFLTKKPPRSKNARDGAYRKLVTKGFSSSVAAAAARAWSEGRETSR